MLILFEEFHVIFNLPPMTSKCNCRMRYVLWFCCAPSAMIYIRFHLLPPDGVKLKWRTPQFYCSIGTCSGVMMRAISRLQTLYAVETSVVPPPGTNLCSAGSMCDLLVDVQRLTAVQPADSLFYQVRSDNYWAVCDSTAAGE